MRRNSMSDPPYATAKRYSSDSGPDYDGGFCACISVNLAMQAPGICCLPRNAVR